MGDVSIVIYLKDLVAPRADVDVAVLVGMNSHGPLDGGIYGRSGDAGIIMGPCPRDNLHNEVGCGQGRPVALVKGAGRRQVYLVMGRQGPAFRHTAFQTGCDRNIPLPPPGRLAACEDPGWCGPG